MTDSRSLPASSFLPTEPIGSIPRPDETIVKREQFEAGRLTRCELDAAETAAVADTIARFEATGSPVITDGEQRKPSFLAYPLQGIDSLAMGDFGIAFSDGHVRRIPLLTAGPFRYGQYAVEPDRRQTKEHRTASNRRSSQPLLSACFILRKASLAIHAMSLSATS